MAHIVMCRVCRQKFDTNKLRRGTEWIMPSRNYYYHVKCYDEWKKSKDHDDEGWTELIFDLIGRDLKGDYNYQMIQAQLKNQVKNKMTLKGIYFSLYWYFIVKKNEWKKYYGIGIVPHIYHQAQAYWISQEEKESGIMQQVEKFAREQKEVQVIKRPKSKRVREIKAPGE